MSNIDNELMKAAEEDAQEIAFIRNQLPQELKDKFSDEELFYFLDVISEFYTESGVFDQEPDADGYVDLDLDEVVDYVVKKAKKEKMGDFDPDDIFFIVEGEIAFSEQFADE